LHDRERAEEKGSLSWRKGFTKKMMVESVLLGKTKQFGNARRRREERRNV
jgi:hypothetical protein